MIRNYACKVTNKKLKQLGFEDLEFQHIAGEYTLRFKGIYLAMSAHTLSLENDVSVVYYSKNIRLPGLLGFLPSINLPYLSIDVPLEEGLDRKSLSFGFNAITGALLSIRGGYTFRRTLTHELIGKRKGVLIKCLANTINCIPNFDKEEYDVAFHDKAFKKSEEKRDA